MNPLNIRGEKLIEVNEAKYLGNLITADSKDEIGMIRACKQLYVQENYLIRKFHVCTENAKIVIFFTHFMQFYCTQSWFSNNNDKYYISS